VRFALLTPVARHRDGRSPLLVAAALAMAVPGILVSACSGQAASQNDAVTAAGRAVAPVPAIRGPATRSRVPATTRRPAAAQAVRLLSQAAQAAIGTSYQGQEIVTRWRDDGGSVLVSNIWHVSGGQTVTQTMNAAASLSSQPYLSSDTGGRAPEGVLGVTAPLVQLLESHYLVGYAGGGSAGSRTAQVVEAWRADGSLAARFWLDDATKLPLEREVFDSAAHVVSQDVFVDVSFPDQAATPASARTSASPPGPWTDPLTHRQLLALRTRGWQVPSQLPGGLSLFTGAETESGTGPVLDLAYSDGLSVISVFEQRGNLAAAMAGWRKTKVDGHVIFVAEPDGRSLTWSSRGLVYTVMADAPTETVHAVIGALPHDGPTGFWKRMSRGLGRLASWVNPFH
jgi:sigma-E factor negative regulatory protein RseB